MKLKITFALPLVALLIGIACKKNTGVEGNNLVYEQTIQGVQKNEPVLLTFTNSNTATRVEWTVLPSAGTNLSAVGNTATVTFRFEGSYTVTATAGSTSARYTVVVTNIEYNPYGSNFGLSASKLVNINRDEPVYFKVYNARTGSQIAWSVYSTAYNIAIDTSSNTAAITFTGGGYGVVTASDGISSQRRTVWVNDPANQNPAYDTVAFVAGEKLQLTPSVEIIGGKQHLVIRARTTNDYHCGGDKILSFSLNNEYAIDYSGVAISPQPCTQRAAAACWNSFSNIPVGVHDFTINFGNKTFVGSLGVSSNGTYSFNWPDNSSVNISPLVVK